MEQRQGNEFLTETWRTFFSEKIFSIEEDNYIRLSMLLTGIATKAVRHVFDTNLKQGELRGVFHKHSRVLNNMKTKGQINDFQHEHLYSKEGPDSKNFDLQLLICILETFHHHNIIKLPPDVLSNLQYIKKTRNEVAHSSTNVFSNQVTDKIWNEIVNAVTSLSVEILYQECNDLRVATLDSSSCDILKCVTDALNQMADMSDECNDAQSSETSYPLQEEEQYFVRLYSLMICIAPIAVRKQLDKVENLQDRLANLLTSNTITGSEYKQLQLVFDSYKENCKLPNGNDKDSEVVVQTKSISTKYLQLSLMLRLFNYLHISRVSDLLPAEDDITTEACLSTINYYYTFVENNSGNSLKAEEFDRAWKSVCKAIQYLSENEISQQLECLRKEIIDDKKKEIIKCMHRLHRKRIDFDTKLAKQTKLNIDVKTNIRRAEEIQLGRNIAIKMKQSEVELWQISDKKYVNNKAADFAMKSLLTNRTVCVIITGVPGRGKTALSRHIALNLQTKRETYIIPISTPDEIREFSDHNERTLFVIDDFCGKYLANQQKIIKWGKIFPDIKSIIGDRSKIIICSRLHIYHNSQLEYLKSTFSSSWYTHIDLQSKRFSLTSEQISLVVERTINFIQYDFVKYSDMYPHFLLDVSVPHNVTKTVLARARLAYENEISILYLENRQQFAALALLISFNNHIEETFFVKDITSETRSLIDNTLFDCGLLQTCSRATLRDELECFVGTYLYKRNRSNGSNVYCAINKTFLNCLIDHMVRNIPKCVGRNADSILLFKWLISNEPILLLGYVFFTESCNHKHQLLLVYAGFIVLYLLLFFSSF